MTTNLLQNLRWIRKKGRDERGREPSQAKFANLLDVDQSTISRFEQGVGVSAMERRLQNIYDHIAHNPTALKAYGIELSWFLPDTLRLPHDLFLAAVGQPNQAPADKSAPPAQMEETSAFSSEESPTTQRLSGCYRLLRWRPASSSQAVAEVVEITAKKSVAEMRLRRLSPQAGHEHDLHGKLMTCGAGFTVALHNTIPNGPTLSLNCIPDSNATIELMLGAATEAVGGFSAALSGAPAFLKRIHLPPGGKLDDAIRQVTEEFSDPVEAWEAEYKTLLSQYGKHFDFWTP